MKVAVYDTHHFERDYLLAANNEHHDLHLLEVGLNLRTAEFAYGCEAIAVFGNDDASAPVIERLASIGVKFIATRSAGYNHIDCASARQHGIKVARVPAYSPYSVAEHAVALMLALNRKLIRAHNRVREMNFSLDGLTGFDMHGKTMGIIGVGKIGAAVARIAHGFGCSVIGYDPAPDTALAAEIPLRYADITTLCRESDIITLHAPLLPETRYIINPETISQMKRGVMLINTSRGGLVDTRAVIKALKSGHIGYLGLDVYEEEQGLFFHDTSDMILQDDVIARLMTFPNVLITSHQAFLTETALHNIAETTIENLTAFEEGRITGNELV